ncbi:hypothetical protein Tco_0851270, partial [Tanacetum coccineum]
REKFDEVSLPERLARSHGLLVLAKVNESLHLLEYYIEGEIWREKFDEVSLPERLARSHGLLVLAKVNESLHLLEYYIEGEIWREKFDEVSLPERLTRSHGLFVLAKVNESLHLLEYYIEGYAVIIGFGVCPDDTSDPKLVKINVNKIKIPYTWVVEMGFFIGVYVLPVWMKDLVLIISFDLKREKFDE